jgi:PST family polysaccharide transporter
MDSSELKHKTFHAVLWALVRVGASNVVSLVVFTAGFSHRRISVFLLLPSWWSTSRIVSSAGLSSAVTRDKDRGELLADTASWANLALGCIVGALTWVLAPLYASAVEQPEITLVVRCLAVLVPVSSLSGIHTALVWFEMGSEWRHRQDPDADAGQNSRSRSIHDAAPTVPIAANVD